MQVQILRIPQGHFALRCPLAQADGSMLPEGWTHIELELDHLRILYTLPQHPRPDSFEIRDPRVSSWLRARIHSGKLDSAALLEMTPLFDGVYRLERTESLERIERIAHGEHTETIAQPMPQLETVAAAIQPAAPQSLAKSRPLRALQPPKSQPLLPRPIRRAQRPSAVAARAS